MTPASLYYHFWGTY